MKIELYEEYMNGCTLLHEMKKNWGNLQLAIQRLKKEPYSIEYKLNEQGKMTNIIFKKDDAYSYIDVIAKGNQCKILFYGDLDSMLMGRNLHHFYLDDIKPDIYEYNREKVEFGIDREFNGELFKHEAYEYLSNIRYNLDCSMLSSLTSKEEQAKCEKAHAQVLECEKYITSHNWHQGNYLMAYEWLDEHLPFINCPQDLLCDFGEDWGLYWSPIWATWFAIIAIAQEKFRKDKK